ncbi:ATP-dependent DNA helicase PIF1-like [Senna tora]|uniref:ATP-dependent DNA helicase n=1 Tax=Senna tora TaxID=362788 RepID=A0A834XGY7_9FABA|nr:ATP-dependent DNA helicase PIF1-like [Senna tora]
MHVIEFQKRGLPDAHMLLILGDDDKLNSPDVYDQIVKAEIPLQSDQPELYTSVLKHMIHGLCGTINPRSPCMQKGKCKRHFPKPFVPYTIQGNDCYPLYRRRDMGQVPLRRGVMELWNEFHHFMTEDYPSSTLIDDPEGNNDVPKCIEDGLSIPFSDTDMQLIDLLNDDQKSAFKSIIDAIEQGRNAMLYVDGPGGTGKTFLYRGRTAHSRFKISLPVDASTTCSISKNSDMIELIRRSTIIVWDEAPMTHRYAFESVDRTFRDINGVDSPFGGKIVILRGDFRKIVLVIPNGSKTQMINASIVNSPLWRHFDVLHLKQNMRSRNDQDMGIPWEGEDPLNDLINHVFPDLSRHMNDTSYMVECAILMLTNEEVNKLNDRIIAKYPREDHILY